jgi:hypothetical protein
MGRGQQQGRIFMGGGGASKSSRIIDRQGRLSY